MFNSNEIPSLKEAMMHFIDPAAYELMVKHGINRTSIFKIACIEAFIKNDQGTHANRLREAAECLANTGILA